MHSAEMKVFCSYSQRRSTHQTNFAMTQVVKLLKKKRRVAVIALSISSLSDALKESVMAVLKVCLFP